MDSERIAALRRWAETTSNGDGDIGRIAGAVADDAGAVDARELAQARKWAKRTAQHGETAELRAVARTLLALTRELAQPAPEPASRAREPRTAPRPGRRFVIVGVALIAAAGVAYGAIAGGRALFAPSLSASGPPRDAALGPVALSRLAFTARASSADLVGERWTLDGRDVKNRVQAAGGVLTFRPGRLAEGGHTLEIASAAGFVGARAHRRFRFAVDLTPPAIRLVRPAQAHRWEALVLAATVERDARVTVDGRPAALAGDHLSVRYTAPLPQTVTIAASDRAGNRAVRHVAVTIVPRRPSVPVRAVHVTFYGWADRSLRRGILTLIAQHRINAVEVDLKDESGIVGFDANVPLARRIGAEQHIYDLASVVRQMHAKGIRVIGRIVCFRDPILATAAWKAGHRDEVVQTPDGKPYSGYGGFTNFANPVVRRYQIDIATAAAAMGIDDVLYDYVRRPDGPRSSMSFPGLAGSPGTAIVGFLRETRLALRPYGTYLGASVFGVAATRPDEVAQPIPQMARQLDYIAPMVYPSHWGPGEYNVADPNAEPYKIVLRSLRDFQRDARGSGARIVPWLQDFSLGRTYGPTEVRAQIDAAAKAGSNEFLLWDAGVSYTAGALSPNAPRAAKGGQRAKPAPAVAKPAPAAPVRRAGGRLPNELGVVPVLMHHEIRPDRVGAYDQTPEEFRKELEQLWAQGYWPVTAAQYATGDLGSVPAGKTPAVLTFDDSTQFQFFYLPNGKIKPTTAVGVMLAFARAHPRFKPAGTFYVLREPFAGVARGPEMLRWLVAHGFELGDHTHDHIPLNTLSAAEVQRELVLGARVITDAVPGYRIRTMALPLGAMPKPASLALTGRWSGQSYRFRAVFLVGGDPSPSPYSTQFDPNAVPRIRSSHLPWNGARDFTAAYWLHELAQHPGERYVSDGDPKRITFPGSERKQLRERFVSRSRTY